MTICMSQPAYYKTQPPDSLVLLSFYFTKLDNLFLLSFYFVRQTRSNFRNYSSAKFTTLPVLRKRVSGITHFTHIAPKNACAECRNSAPKSPLSRQSKHTCVLGTRIFPRPEGSLTRSIIYGKSAGKKSTEMKLVKGWERLPTKSVLDLSIKMV
ncbi:hypothetical protein BU26DRAFT_187439 [Trematosphaeria pertusa]|uniref:Uncharacterized protein n=1 Tax=Trematosphaeria pertusa TaxID=390896 RepID=A0A6A6HSE5_9PLEO|nr:uncharacterized protein BU26DRAFT_187439 [Trematosphaeria pertusa]KAF2241095.1 hypothetical protein BU26DRAFT_187439 [Trematosphaeria pertusa]